MTQWNALVLAGADPEDAFAQKHGVSAKPLIAIQGKPMAWYVLKALQNSGQVKQIAYIGDTSPEITPMIHTVLQPRGSLLDNLHYGVEQLGTHHRVLVVTADIPMLTARELQDVLAHVPSSAVVYPIVRKESCEQAYPSVKRTYARLRDGTFTGGNIFVLEPQLIATFLPRLREVLAHRKNPLKLASLIGFGTLFKLLLGRLSILELERKVSAILGVEARAYITPHASVGTDVDKDSDLALAEQQLRTS